MGRGLLGLVLLLGILGVVAGIVVGTGGPTLPRTGAHGAVTTPAGAPAAEPVDRASLAASCAADARSVESAAQAYQAANGTYPQGVTALVPGWLREAPGVDHYTIYLDPGGHVGVFPANSAPSGPVGASADFDLHPERCQSVPR